MLLGERRAADVRRLIGDHDARASSVNIGEVYYSLARSHGHGIAFDRAEAIRQVIRVHDPDWPLVRDAARIKADGRLSYADAFCIATGRRYEAPVVTGDPGIIAMTHLVEVIDLS